MKLYNAHTQQLELLPMSGERVTIYACSSAPYPTMYLEHAFVYSVVDCLIRYLEYQGHRVHYIQIVTDLDDQVLRTAAETNENGCSVRQRWVSRFRCEMQALNLRPPDECFVQEAREQPQVEILIQGAPFSALSLHTAKVEYPPVEELCSVFIRGRGAQTLSGSPLEVETVNNGAGNPVTVRDLLTHYSPDVLRFYLASNYYRRNWGFYLQSLARAADLANVLDRAVAVQSGSGRRLAPASMSRYTIGALDEDLNTTTALSSLVYLAEQILKAAAAGWQVQEAQSTLRALSGVFGLRLGIPVEPHATAGWHSFSPDFADRARGHSHRTAIHRERLQLAELAM